jgi:hypothetical protein
MNAASADVAQLAMLRLLWLQRETRRAVRARHREAAVMLARASVETLLLGLYCLREKKAVDQLNAASSGLWATRSHTSRTPGSCPPR